MIDIMKEELISLSRAAQIARVSDQRVRLWTRGKETRHGTKLEIIVLGPKITRTSCQALARFIQLESLPVESKEPKKPKKSKKKKKKLK